MDHALTAFPNFPGVELTDEVLNTAQGSIPLLGLKAEVLRIGGKRKITAGRALLGVAAIALAKKEGGQLMLELEGSGRTLSVPVEEDEELARSFARAVSQLGRSKIDEAKQAAKAEARNTKAQAAGNAQNDDAANADGLEAIDQVFSAGPPPAPAELLFARAHKHAQEGVLQGLEDGETVRVVILGEQKGTVIATDRRAFVYKGGITTDSFFSRQLNSWDYRNISGVELRRNMACQSVILQVPGVAPGDKDWAHGQGSEQQLGSTERDNREHQPGDLRGNLGTAPADRTIPPTDGRACPSVRTRSDRAGEATR